VPEHLSGPDAPDAQAGVRPPESAPATIQAVLAGAPPLQRLALGLLVVILGGVLLSQTLLGLPVLASGAWLITGRGLPELGRALQENSAYLLRCALSIAFFAAAIWQAFDALLPTLPLFGICVVLLPSRRDQEPVTRFLHSSPTVREALVVLLLVVYGWLLARDLSEKSEAGRQIVVRALARQPEKTGLGD